MSVNGKYIYICFYKSNFQYIIVIENTKIHNEQKILIDETLHDCDNLHNR